MKNIVAASVGAALFAFSCAPKKTVNVSYPEKFEGLTQLVLASETKTLVFSDTTVQKVFGLFKLGTAQIKVTASVTFDFYVDFKNDGYTMKFSEGGDSLTFDAPPLRAKKPVVNSSNVTYPEKSLFIDEKEKAIQKLETLTDEFTDDGEDLVREDYVVEKCKEMLSNYILDLCKKMGYSVKVITVHFARVIA
jgi:hypothetical protein